MTFHGHYVRPDLVLSVEAMSELNAPMDSASRSVSCPCSSERSLHLRQKKAPLRRSNSPWPHWTHTIEEDIVKGDRITKDLRVSDR